MKQTFLLHPPLLPECGGDSPSSFPGTGMPPTLPCPHNHLETLAERQVLTELQVPQQEQDPPSLGLAELPFQEAGHPKGRRQAGGRQ